MPAGRPSKYDPKFCDVVLGAMTDGYSKMAAAGIIGVCYSTLKNWMAEYPEFLAAVKAGDARRAVKLERDLLNAESGPMVTSRIFALKNAAPEEWRDQQRVEHTGADGGPIEMTGTEKLASFLAERSAKSP